MTWKVSMGRKTPTQQQQHLLTETSNFRRYDSWVWLVIKLNCHPGCGCADPGAPIGRPTGHKIWAEESSLTLVRTLCAGVSGYYYRNCIIYRCSKLYIRTGIIMFICDVFSVFVLVGMCCTSLSYICAASWQNQQNNCTPSEDSDQPGYPPSLIIVFAVRSKGS